MSLLHRPFLGRAFSWCVLVCCLFLYSSQVFSWSHRGHAGISSARYKILSTSEKTFYDQLAYDLAKTAPKNKSRDKRWQQIMKNGGRFMALTAWVDAVRDVPLGELYAQFNQAIPAGLKKYEEESTSRWHYHNDFVFSDTKNQNRCKLSNRGRLFDRSQQLHNVLFSTTLASGGSSPNTLGSSNTLSAQQYIITLALFLHLLEDAHQPLHTVSHVGKACQHDRGGNSMCMKPFGRKATKKSKCKVSLHQLWDRGFGVFDHSLNVSKLELTVNTYTPTQYDTPAQYPSTYMGIKGMLQDTFDESIVQGKRIYAFLAQEDVRSVTSITPWGAKMVASRAELAVLRSAQYLRYVYQHNKRSIYISTAAVKNGREKQ